MSIGAIVAVALIVLVLGAMIYTFIRLRKEKPTTQPTTPTTPTTPVTPVTPTTPVDPPQPVGGGDVEGPSKNPDEPTTKATIKKAKSMV